MDVWIDFATKAIRLFEVSFITIIIGFIAAKLAQKVASWFVEELKVGSKLIPVIIEQVLYVVTIVVVIFRLGLGKIFLGLLAIVLLAFILWSLIGVRDVLRNFRARKFVISKVHLGKEVKVGKISGKIKRVGITSLRVKDKDLHAIPYLLVRKEFADLKR